MRIWMLIILLFIPVASAELSQSDKDFINENSRTFNDDYKRYVDNKIDGLSTQMTSEVDTRYTQFTEDVTSIQNFFRNLVIKAVISVFGIFMLGFSLHNFLVRFAKTKVKQIDPEGVSYLSEHPPIKNKMKSVSHSTPKIYLPPPPPPSKDKFKWGKFFTIFSLVILLSFILIASTAIYILKNYGAVQ